MNNIWVFYKNQYFLEDIF